MMAHASKSGPESREGLPGQTRGRPFLGLAFALAILAAVEAVLHTDLFLMRYRSVFAVGRAMDKMHFVEAHVPRMLLSGNSRIDNGFNPRVLMNDLPRLQKTGVFNLGIPGADSRILFGVLTRLAREDLLGPGAVERIVIGLDEGMIQSEDSLGYAVFFGERAEFLRQAEYADWLRSVIRLWGFADNLKELREPAKAQRFLEASYRPVEPLGGGAAENLGYRAGIGGLQDADMAFAQEVGSRKPPDVHRVRYFELCLELLARHQVKVAILFPPLLNRDVLYLDEFDPGAAPFRQFAKQLRARGIRMIELDRGGVRTHQEFVNAGHLNDIGATRFSHLLADKLGELWPELKEPKAQ